jgi:hypothetical protein
MVLINARLLDAKKNRRLNRQRFLAKSIGMSAGRTRPYEGYRRRNPALDVVRRRIALFGGIPRNMNTIVAVENIEHFCTSKRNLLLPSKCASCLKFDQENSPQHVAFAVLPPAILHNTHIGNAYLPWRSEALAVN